MHRVDLFAKKKKKKDGSKFGAPTENKIFNFVMIVC